MAKRTRPGEAAPSTWLHQESSQRSYLRIADYLCVQWLSSQHVGPRDPRHSCKAPCDLPRNQVASFLLHAIAQRESGGIQEEGTSQACGHGRGRFIWSHIWGPTTATSLVRNLNQERQTNLRYLKYLWEQHRAKINTQ